MSQQEATHFAVGTQSYYPGQAYNTPAMLQVAASINALQGRLLDIGCGDGQLLKLLAERFPNTEFAGLTVSEEEQRVSDERFDVRVGDMRNLPWKDGVFDTVISRHSLEHSISPLTALFEVNRVLRLDGVFHVVVPAPVSEWVVKWKDHFSVLSKPMWEKLFDDAGFVVEHYEDGDWLASFSMQYEPEMRFVLRKIRDIRLGSISSQQVDDIPIITEQEPKSAALSTLVERRIVVVLHNLMLFDAIRPVVASFRRDVKFLIPRNGDSGFDAMGEQTLKGIMAAGFEVELVTLPADVRCDIELSPYPYATRNVCHAKWRVRFMYGLAKEAWNFSLENNVYYDFVLTYGDYDSQVLSAYTTPVCIGNPKITKVVSSSRVQGDRQVLLYLPTYGPTSSIEAVCSIQNHLKTQYQVIAKVHHGTTYLESERVSQLQSWVDELAHHDTSLSSLLSRADVVLSDGSGAIFDAIAAGVPIVVFQNKIFGGLEGSASLEERLVRDAQIPATDLVDEIPSILAHAVQAGAVPFESLQRELFVALGDDAAKRGVAFLTELLAGSKTLDTFAVARQLLITRLAEGMIQHGARVAAERQLDESYRNLTDRLLADVQDIIAKLAERDEQIANLNQEVTEHEKRLQQAFVSMNEMRNSTSWRITSPLRAIGRSTLVRPILFQFRRLVRRYRELGLEYMLQAVMFRTLNKLRMSSYAYKFDSFVRAWKKINPIDWTKVSVPYEPGLVSIVLPAYNGDDMVAEAMDSILAQTYRQIEIIAINDGSIDGTLEILKTYAEKDNRVKVYDQKNQKLPRTLSRGFRLARGEFFTWTSVDNRLKTNCIELMVASLKRNQHWDMVYANLDIIGEDSQPLRNSDWYIGYQNPPGSEHIHLPSDVSELNTWPNNYVGAAFLYRARVAWALGDYSPCRFLTEDYDYWMRVNELMSLRHADFDDCIYDYRFHGKSLTSKDKELGITKNRVKLMVFDDFRRSHLLSKNVWVVTSDGSKIGEHLMSSLLRELRRREDIIHSADEIAKLNLSRLWMPVVHVHCTERATDAKAVAGLTDTACRVLLASEQIPEIVEYTWDLYITTAPVEPGDLHRIGDDGFSGWCSVNAVPDVVTLCNIRAKGKQLAAIELETSSLDASPDSDFISVVVCTYRRSATLENCLRSLVHQNISPADYEIVIVNNEPTDSSPRDFLEKLRSDYTSDRLPAVCIVDCPLPGLSYARNVGISSARGAVIVFMDDDAIAKDDCLEKLSLAFRRNSETAIIGGHIRLNLPTPRPEVCPPGREGLWSQYLTNYVEFQVVDHWREFPYGALWAARRKVLFEMGGFRYNFGRLGNDFGGGEEIVASLLASQLGYRVGIEPRAEVLHDVELHRYSAKHVEKTIQSALIVNYKMQTALYVPNESSLPLVLKDWVRNKRKQFVLTLKILGRKKMSTVEALYAVSYAKGSGLILKEKIRDFFCRFKRPQTSNMKSHR